MEMSGYQPAPPTMQQQQSSNVVVVNSQPTEQPVGIIHVARANDYLCCSVCLCLLCLFTGNWLALLCAFPAVIFSCIASTHNDVGENELARRFGSLACKCNIGTILPSIITGIAVIIVIILLAAGVIVAGGAAASVTTSESVDDYGT